MLELISVVGPANLVWILLVIAGAVFLCVHTVASAMESSNKANAKAHEAIRKAELQHELIESLMSKGVSLEQIQSFLKAGGDTGQGILTDPLCSKPPQTAETEYDSIVSSMVEHQYEGTDIAKLVTILRDLDQKGQRAISVETITSMFESGMEVDEIIDVVKAGASQATRASANVAVTKAPSAMLN